MADKPNFARYEFMALASRLYTDPNRKGYSIPAIMEFYTSCGLDKDDPIILNAINTGAIERAIKLYDEKFTENYESAKVSEVASHFDYAEFPKEIKALLEANKDKKVSDIIKEAKGQNKDALKIINVLELLKFRHMEKTLWGEVVEKIAKGGLENIVSA